MTDTGQISKGVDAALNDVARSRVIPRLWAHDYTLWSDDPREITQPSRLGWLDVMASMTAELPRLHEFAAAVAGEGYRDAVLLGMGGSSLAPEVLQTTLGNRSGTPRLRVLDTTHPDAILALTRQLDLARTLFIVSSKSGTTVETRSHADHFWSLLPDGRSFVAITDAGTPLQHLAEERGFRDVFLNRPDIGGRYSALSFFGLLPAALIGADLEALLTSAQSMATACLDENASANPGALLGTVMGEASVSGRDKLTLLLPGPLASFGNWAEQLLAESTGKQGRGIIPIVAEPSLPAESYGNDRLFVAAGKQDALDTLPQSGQPVLDLLDSRIHGSLAVQEKGQGEELLGAQFFLWEFATAVAGSRLGINPFDQPNVQSAKDATDRVLSGSPVDLNGQDPARLLETVAPNDYIAILAFLPPDEATSIALQDLRGGLGRRYGVATTLGFGPRYLHSTGQLHKGGPNSGVFLVLTDDAADDVPIPGRPYSFDVLRNAQAAGDVQSLIAAGRRVARVNLGRDRLSAIGSLKERLA